jgi:hypothetical protein
MLSDILVIFILTISGKPDLYSTQVFAPTAQIDCASDLSQLKPQSYQWAMQAIVRNNLINDGIQPSDVSIKCIEVEHIDPDTQLKEEGA